MPRFTHVSTYPFPRESVFEWHTRPGGFVRLTPPGTATLLHGPTDGINVGSELRLRVSTPVLAGLLPNVSGGPVGAPWLVRHVALEPGHLFVDEQVEGPFTSWRHEHEFTDGPDGSTVLTDTVTWALPRVVPAGIVEGRLRAMFRFREAQLRADLELLARLDAAPSTVVVSGASGMIGSQLRALLTTAGHRVVRLVRSQANGPDEVRWDPKHRQLPDDALDGAAAVINLSGETIGGRFTESRKAEIMASRLAATGTLADAVARRPETALIQASAIGYYGPRRPGELLDEGAPRGTGFLADVVEAWEQAAAPAAEAGARVVHLRTGIVLSAGGGALLPQLPLFLAGVGGRMAGAAQGFSWVGLDDLVRAYVHATFTRSLEGPVNAVGPAPVTQQEFAKALGRALHRPVWLPTPAFGPKLILGEEGFDQLIDTDQRVSSAKLEASGFRFAQPTVGSALAHALQKE